MPKLKNDINKELLIDLVHKRPAIWNKNTDVYKDKQLKYAAWREICAILKEDFEQLNKSDSHAYVKSITAIWAQTRDSWVRSLHEKKKVSRSYLYHKQMLFLKEVVSFPDIQEDVPKIRRINRNRDMEVIVKEERYVSEVELDTDSGEDDKSVEQTNSSSNEEEFQDTNRKPIRAIEEVDVLSTRSDEKILEAARTSKRMQEIDQRIMSYMGSRISNVVTDQEDRHMLFFKSILPSLSLLNDDQILEFQSGVIRLLQNIKKGHHNDE